MGAFDGKVAVVTGGARGVGFGHAKLLAYEGASVVVNDLGGDWNGEGKDDRPAQQAVDEIVAAGGSAVANFDDVSDWDGGQNVVQQAIDTYGKLDILICNAGNLRDRMSYNMSADEWDSVVRVHLRGHFVPVRAAGAHFRSRFKVDTQPVNGRIVLTSSEAGLFGNAGQINYASVKAGIAAMSIVLARELARMGVTANAICPRARTRLTENTFGAFNVAKGEFDVWDADNVAPWVAFLCSEDAGHISGQTFVVGGGRVELVQAPTVVSSIDKDDRWELDELPAKAAELFGDRPTQPVSFPVGTTLPVN